MTYRELGKAFCDEINDMLYVNDFDASFVTGGGYAYDSIKYSTKQNKGDFDFMIVYDRYDTVRDIIEQLKKTNFLFENRYLPLDLDLLENNNIDIIRLSGKYREIKSTINLVPISLIEKICTLKEEFIIKKIAHNRNTSLFFAYGSDNSRITVNFISPSFVTDDGEDHYVHLDFSNIKRNNNIYFGILSDAVLKGFGSNYDKLHFAQLRGRFIDNIHEFFQKNNIDSSLYLNLFSNHVYFPKYIKEQLLDEFESRGKIVGTTSPAINNEFIVFTTNFNTKYPKKPFNFIHNKEYQMTFDDYIEKMQDTEYDRQYLIDAIGKFFGYVLSSTDGYTIYNEDDIISKMDVYGTNDLYLAEISKYKRETILEAFIRSLAKNKEKYNEELFYSYMMIAIKFLSGITSDNVENILKKYDLVDFNKPPLNDKEMEINTILNTKSFNELGTYHNYTSKVMPNYTNMECQFLNDQFQGQEDKMILDIMCGYGRIANQLKKMGYKNIWGIDSESYEFLHVLKDFTFVKDDYLHHNFSQCFDFSYSLYNCYNSKEYLYSILQQTYQLLNDGGLFVLDCFNKAWRDQVPRKFENSLYKDEHYVLKIRRDYDINVGNETTWYELYEDSKKVKEYKYIQRFFSQKDLAEVINERKWQTKFLDSSEGHSRNNSQKHILVLRKKL